MMETPWDRARKRQSGKQPKHARSEQHGAGASGRMQVNSGRFWFSKRDFTKFNFLFENRQTDHDSYRVKVDELKKITSEAIFENALPAMRLDFSAKGEDWTLIRSVDFEAFFQALKLAEGLVEQYERELDENKD